VILDLSNIYISKRVIIMYFRELKSRRLRWFPTA